MRRYKITVEYDGTHFSGWQRQQSSLSVQQTLEDAIEKFAHKKTEVFGAGRTDSGVHAIGQVAHFDLETHYDRDKIKKSLNHFIAPNVVVSSIDIVSNTFHSRFDAYRKRYLYKIINGDTPLVLMRNRAWLLREAIDFKLLQQACSILLGKHDFSSFRSSSCQASSPVKTLDLVCADIVDGVIIITFEARSFLHNQVRIMTSALKNVGIGKWSCEQLRTVLESRDRRLSAQTAPPYGLYLSKIWYTD